MGRAAPFGPISSPLCATLLFVWGKESRLVDTDPNIDEINTNDGLSALEDRARSAEVLAAFQALPERWQRVLWLTEVEEASRTEIAALLGLKPNAVSALVRRARKGLRQEWLTEQIHPDLRSVSQHVAHAFPAMLSGQKAALSKTQISDHLAECERCRLTEQELRNSSRRFSQEKTLTFAGFAALGVTLPTAGALISTTAATTGVAALLGTLAAGTTAVAAGIAVIVGAGVTGGPAGVNPSPAEETVASEQHSGVDSTGSNQASQPPNRSEPAEQSAAAPAAPGLPHEDAEEGFVPYVAQSHGRGVTDSEVPGFSGTYDFDTIEQRPARLGTTGPSEAIEPPGSAATPPGAPGSGGTPGQQGPEAGPGSSDPQSGEDGSDGELPAPSPLTPVALEPSEPPALTVAGFEGVQTLDLDEASSTGVVVLLTSEAADSVHVHADSGQSALVPLNAQGQTSLRLTFLAGGFYTISFAAISGDSSSDWVEFSLFVDDPAIIFTPFGPDLWVEFEAVPPSEFGGR